MPISIAPMGSLSADESRQLAGCLIAAALESHWAYVPSESYARASRALGLPQAVAVAAGPSAGWWQCQAGKLCEMMEARGLLAGDGMGSYKATALGEGLAAEHGVEAAGALAAAYPWIPPPPEPPMLSKLGSWLSGRRGPEAPGLPGSRPVPKG